MLSLSYNERNNHASRLSFSQLTGCNDTSETINIDKEFGNGSLEIINIEDGLYIRIWDCVFYDKIEFHRKSSLENEELYFSLNYYITPQSFLLPHPLEEGIQLNSLWNTLFACSKVDFKLEILPHLPAKSITICFTRQWLERLTVHIPPKQRGFIYSIVNNTKPVFYFETSNITERKMIQNIFEDKGMKKIGSLFLKSRIVTLIHEFITKSSERQSLLAPSHNNIYEFNIRLVEKKLINSFETALPSSKDLAHEFGFSDSTLKRNFKKVYGKTIRDYYLDKKMIYAKELLSDHNKTVTEIAYLLGYEKVSQFIVTFKKHIGCLPGIFRRGVA
jgi:AraC-like DNA-binding protein